MDVRFVAVCLIALVDKRNLSINQIDRNTLHFIKIMYEERMKVRTDDYAFDKLLQQGFAVAKKVLDLHTQKGTTKKTKHN